MSRPAILGGAPAFPDGLPFARPARPPLERVVERLRPSYERGTLTDGPLVRELEAQVADRLGVRHVVATSSCSSGLLLALRVLAPGRGAVVLPSFTFSASAHAVAWNGLEPRFAECDADRFQLDPGDAERRLEGAGTLLPTHVFGAPCAAERFEELARRAGIPLVFDAAHAFGALRRGRPVGGFGDAEVFSLTPTKPLVAGEGGLVATRHDEVAERLRWGRNYGNPPGDYDTRFVGLNARMSELHAAVALEALAGFEAHLARRRELAARYHTHLEQIPGVSAQAVDPDDSSTYKDFTVAVEPEVYGIGRDALVSALRAEGVDTRCYFWPPVHLQQAYAPAATVDLPVTVHVAHRVVSLPIYPDLSEAAVDAVAEVLARLQRAGPDVDAAVAAGSRG
ncbi:MAG: DegT/DnrJ/EryC1/StrS family aminotransferase [Acidimicrobiia bacterium]